ncbi:protein kinase domain-containing protein [Nocardia donostiensis]|uniref:non-specific serine/threonine protein kinase n=1 Tax=Nocardia donostiensis TaxID=1538463 RepID=A0A1V2THV8_9NOCA|nr:protein kinase [Nocardia donostiensis]ONM49096.1 serine/threonine protein kinase [Nocardia donostiensis]OQS14114.1 serine/threonine protein kinase [Nocardia donostiensis]OQS19725.1 serine/threonine protein kinase [Nocardia donostiensis]
MLNNGAMIADRYRLQRLIATGGMGQVWEALDTRLDRRVAVKVLKAEFSADPTFRHRFRTEAKTTAQLNHPGIAGIYDYGETIDPQGGEMAYLVMELVQGEPLNTVLNRLGRLSVVQGLDMLEQTGRALQVAHAAGVVHRDVKPGNILVTPTGQVKITDFGIAKAVDASPVTKTGMVMGTAQYIAPEQAVGEDATSASDVYSLGIVGYEALAGERPFSGDGAITVAMKHVRETPPPMPTDLPGNVRELIEITIGKDPTQRYADGGEFADAVAAVRAGRRPPPPRGMAATGPMTEGATRVLPPGPTVILPSAQQGYDNSATARYAPAAAAGAGARASAGQQEHFGGPGDRDSGDHRKPSGQKWMAGLGAGAVVLAAAAAWLLFGGDTNPDGSTTTGTSTVAPTTTRQLPPPVPTTFEPEPEPEPEPSAVPQPTMTQPTTTPPPTTEPTTTEPEPTTTEPTTTEPEPTTTTQRTTTTRPRVPTIDIPLPEIPGARGPSVTPTASATYPQGQP